MFLFSLHQIQQLQDIALLLLSMFEREFGLLPGRLVGGQSGIDSASKVHLDVQVPALPAPLPDVVQCMPKLGLLKILANQLRSVTLVRHNMNILAS